MNGGLIEQIELEPNGIFIHVSGVGCYRHKVTILRIEPTNCCLRVGDLVWWQSDKLHWEGNRQMDFECHKLDAVTTH